MLPFPAGYKMRVENLKTFYESDVFPLIPAIFCGCRWGPHTVRCVECKSAVKSLKSLVQRPKTRAHLFEQRTIFSWHFLSFPLCDFDENWRTFILAFSRTIEQNQKSNMLTSPVKLLSYEHRPRTSHTTLTSKQSLLYTTYFFDVFWS